MTPLNALSRHFNHLALSMFLLAAVAACGAERTPGSGDGLPRGPDGGFLVFDAAMIGASRDAALPIDASPTDLGWDAGPRDAGPRDLGSRRVCRGVPYTCLGSTRTTCEAQQGCTYTEDCAGVASSCYYRSSSYSCNSQQGCYWSSYSDNCSGSPRSCSLFGSSSCTGQDGCYFSRDCGGSPTPCSLFSESTCSSQLGCRLEVE